MSHMTTSEGRKYRRTQFKRLVALVKKEYQAKGIAMRESKIERNLLEKAAKEFVNFKNTVSERQMLTQRATRQSHFEKNYKKR